jgi:hypothetical protein
MSEKEENRTAVKGRAERDLKPGRSLDTHCNAFFPFPPSLDHASAPKEFQKISGFVDQLSLSRSAPYEQWERIKTLSSSHCIPSIQFNS